MPRRKEPGATKTPPGERGGVAPHPADPKSQEPSYGLPGDYPALWVAATYSSGKRTEAYQATLELWEARKFRLEYERMIGPLQAELAALRLIADAATRASATRDGVHFHELAIRLSYAQTTPENVPTVVRSNDDGMQAALARAERDATRWEKCAADLERRLSAQAGHHRDEKAKLELQRADAERATATLREAVRVAAGLPDGSCTCEDRWED